MAREFKDRLSSGQLTQADQYRKLQRSLTGKKATGKKSTGDVEEWTKWQLEPLSADVSDNDDSDLLDPQSDAAQGLYQAVRILDRK